MVDKTRLENQVKIKETKHRKKIQQQNLVQKIENETKEMLLPSIREKAEKVSELIVEKLKEDKEIKGLTASQIIPLIANRSLVDIALANNITYTSQELAIAFNIYLEMWAKINEYVKYPQNKQNFCSLLGISVSTFDNYMQDAEKSEITRFIDDCISNTNITSAQLGELREITTMFINKSQHKWVEAQAPTVIEYKKTTDIDEIKSKIAEIKKGKIIEADFKEVDNNEKR